MVTVCRPQSYAGAVIQPEPSLLWLFHRHFQPLTSPQALNALVIDQPTGVSQQSGDATISIPAKLPRQLDHIRHQPVFVCLASRVATLGGSVLAKHAADPAFGHRQFATNMVDAGTTTCGA